jgi:putative membrane protein
MPLSFIPRLNAVLNATSAVLLCAGFVFIRCRRTAAHRLCMIAALCVSALFLVSYLVHHYQVGITLYAGAGWPRTVYHVILATHTLLAAAVPPLAIVTLVRALRERFDAHRRIARVTLPIWLYVSVTGVVIYLMLRSSYTAHP